VAILTLLSNSCKNSEVLAPLPPALRQALDLTTTATARVAEDLMPGPGSVAQPAALLPGAAAIRTGITKVEARRPVLLEVQLRGLVTAATATAEVAVATIGTAETLTTVVATLTVEVLLRLALLLGTRLLQHRLPTQVLMLVMAPMALRRE
jgi:hypothetical protein